MTLTVVAVPEPDAFMLASLGALWVVEKPFRRVFSLLLCEMCFRNRSRVRDNAQEDRPHDDQRRDAGITGVHVRNLAD